MKIKNSTNWPMWMLRRMTAWCAKEIGLPMSNVDLAVFRNSSSAWGGCARYWRKQITVCVGSASRFPTNGYKHRNGYQERIIDRLECLVWVTAHELCHLFQHREHSRTRQGGSWGGSEIATEWHAKPVLEKFRQERTALLEEWQREPVAALRAATRAAIPPIEKRASKASADLARWQRKLKLAQTKVRKLRIRVRYYETKKGGTGDLAPPLGVRNGQSLFQPLDNPACNGADDIR